MTNKVKCWKASIERPKPEAITATTFGFALDAGRALQTIAYAGGYGVEEFGHPVYPTVTISEVEVEVVR